MHFGLHSQIGLVMDTSAIEEGSAWWWYADSRGPMGGVISHRSEGESKDSTMHPVVGEWPACACMCVCAFVFCCRCGYQVFVLVQAKVIVIVRPSPQDP